MLPTERSGWSTVDQSPDVDEPGLLLVLEGAALLPEGHQAAK